MMNRFQNCVKDFKTLSRESGKARCKIDCFKTKKYHICQNQLNEFLKKKL